MKSGIYKIANLVNGKLYIGSAMNIGKRWSHHKNTLGRNAHENPRLQNAWNFHGGINFQFSIIETCSVDVLLVREQHYIDRLNPDYNICRIAGSNFGKPVSQETRIKLSVAGTGKRHSEESKMKMSIAQKGKTFSEEARRKMSEVRTGKVASEETRKKMSVAHTGNKNLLGHRHSQEAREKMSKARKGKKKRKEWQNKITESLKMSWVRRKQKAQESR